MGDMRAVASMQAAAAPALAAAAAAMPRTASAPSLKILHILRAPLGGLFRHVVDVASGQSARGHRVGLIVDSTTGGARADAALAELLPHLALGLQRVAIARELGPSDIFALHVISQRIGLLGPDVLHGHGAKGAALARLAPSAPNAIRVYTPHGGSLVYSPGTLRGDGAGGVRQLGFREPRHSSVRCGRRRKDRGSGLENRAGLGLGHV